jgi:carboxyl-terminal processing protease
MNNRFIAFFLFFIIMAWPSWSKQDTCNIPPVQKFYEAYQIIKDNYVTSIDDTDLVDSAISGMLASLDPHSGFLNKEMYGELNSYSKGEFGGIGVEVVPDNGLIKIVAPLDDSPAAQAGIQAGDYIIGINGESIYGSDVASEIAKLRGEPGSLIKLSILRNNNPPPIEIEVKRSIIKILSVKARVINNDIAYIRVSSFSANVAKNIIKDLKELTSQHKNLKGIILDLRNNPGGLLLPGIEVADIFLKDGEVVYTKGRNADDDVHYEVTKNGYKNTSLPMVVLINEGSASASEIVAGALQDHKRAIIMGARSFGKGSVQEIIPLKGGVAIGLTTALYYTPNGRSIQAEGIIPDIIVEQSVIKETEYGDNSAREENLIGHINNNGTIKKDRNNLMLDKLKNKGNIVKKVEEDYQLERAIDLIEGVNIYKDSKINYE